MAFPAHQCHRVARAQDLEYTARGAPRRSRETRATRPRTWRDGDSLGPGRAGRREAPRGAAVRGQQGRPKARLGPASVPRAPTRARSPPVIRPTTARGRRLVLPLGPTGAWAYEMPAGGRAAPADRTGSRCLLRRAAPHGSTCARSCADDGRVAHATDGRPRPARRPAQLVLVRGRARCRHRSSGAPGPSVRCRDRPGRHDASRPPRRRGGTASFPPSLALQQL